VVCSLADISARETTSSGVKEEARVAMSMSPADSECAPRERARREPAHHTSRRATGGLLQDGAVGNDRAVRHAQPSSLEALRCPG
jgi:hypothetical protein